MTRPATGVEKTPTQSGDTQVTAVRGLKKNNLGQIQRRIDHGDHEF